MRPAPKPTITDKLVAWQAAFHAIADELLARSEADTLATIKWAQENGLGVGAVTVNGNHVEAAARTAAILIGGTDLGNDRP